MTETKKRDEFVYHGAGFPVKLAGFPFKKVNGDEVLDVDLEKLDVVIACLVLMKPAFLTGREIRFLRTVLGESLAVFGQHFDVSAAGVKKWEDLGEKNMGIAMNDFAIRNFVSRRLAVQFEMNVDFMIHKSVLDASAFWRVAPMEIPFSAMAKYARMSSLPSRV